MPKTNPQNPQDKAPTQAEYVLPETTSQRTHLADDVSNLPTGEVEQSGPVTYNADHVPEDAPAVLSSRPQTKVVGAPATETPKPADTDAETA